MTSWTVYLWGVAVGLLSASLADRVTNRDFRSHLIAGVFVLIIALVFQIR